MALPTYTLAAYEQAVVDDYYFEMLLDELPIWGYVGELETKSVRSSPYPYSPEPAP